MQVINDDCRNAMRGMDADSISAIVTDPPYGLKFMGKGWDNNVPGIEFWEEALRVAKPGCHLLAFGGTRTYHRLTCAIEDAGWEIRDSLMWVYGSGFPKSHDVSKAIDKESGAEREKIKTKARPESCGTMSGKSDTRPWIEESRKKGYHEHSGPNPVTDAAKLWEGWGTALKPSWEPIILARKPLAGTVAGNVLEHGTGAINIDACRVAPTGEVLHSNKGSFGKHEGWRRPWMNDPESIQRMAERSKKAQEKATELGRWPANFIHDGSDEVTDLLGSAARFFYCPQNLPAIVALTSKPPLSNPLRLLR